jgi:23S rRNA (pseudouridine1915-N3)-methyltransferase
MITEIKIVCIGKVKEKYIQEGINEFLKRLGPFCKVKIIELKDEGLKKEAEKLKEHFSEKTLILNEKGAEFSSMEFAHLIKTLDYDITFIIGGHN